MNGTGLSSADLIGKRITSVYHEDGRIVNGFQQRSVIVELDNRILFDFARIKVRDKLVEIESRPFSKTFKLVLSPNQDLNLASPIKSLVHSESFFYDAGILLQNGFVLTVGVSEKEEEYMFYHAPASISAGFIELTITGRPIA